MVAAEKGELRDARVTPGAAFDVAVK